MPLVRYLEWFDHDTERFAGRIVLVVTLEELQKLFAVSRDDPMYDCWEVKPDHVASLEIRTGHVIDLNRFAYSVSAEGD